MKTNENYLEVNRVSWNQKVAAHLTSDFYNLQGFLKTALLR